LAAFTDAKGTYKTHFEAPLDAASKLLRSELAQFYEPQPPRSDSALQLTGLSVALRAPQVPQLSAGIVTASEAGSAERNGSIPQPFRMPTARWMS